MKAKAVITVFDEIRRAARASADLKSFVQIALDLILCRDPLLRLIPKRWRNRERSVTLRDGVKLTYRLNKGDIWSLREVWLFDCYTFPADIAPDCILDLGANIGLTSAWLGLRYKPTTLIAVEPVASNAALARRNLEQNGVDAVVIDAAAGCRDGSVNFVEASESNLGKADYGSSGSTPVISINTLLNARCNGERIGLLKFDIEGGEQELLTANTEWLQKVDAIIAEFHPACVDYSGLIATLQQLGFRYIAAHSVSEDNMDCFVREPLAV
jgi:FkbM family methyltransferase